ncbi:MAG: glycogen-binding domain-containing protein [Kiritimatiellia bacterium]
MRAKLTEGKNTKARLGKPVTASGAVGKKTKPLQVEFRAKAPEGSEVFLAGSFNHWDPKMTPLTHKGGGLYSTAVSLSPGRYEYKFVIDGKWQLDEECPLWSPNDQGSLNSVADVK